CDGSHHWPLQQRMAGVDPNAMSASTARLTWRCCPSGCAGACGSSAVCTVSPFVGLEERLVGQLQGNGVEADVVAVGIVHAEQDPAHGCAVHAVVVHAEFGEVGGERFDGIV